MASNESIKMFGMMMDSQLNGTTVEDEMQADKVRRYVEVAGEVEALRAGFVPPVRQTLAESFAADLSESIKEHRG